MAVFKLGAIITDIAGSTGGTTFRRNAGGKTMYNKSRGSSKSKLLKNIWLSNIAVIFRAWQFLTPAIRLDWQGNALLYQFPNKFGALRNLTGRQLFTKLSLQLMPVGASVPEPDQINNIVSSVVIDNFDISSALTSAELQYIVSGDASWVLCQLEVSRNLLSAPIYSKRKISAFAFLDSSGGFDVISQLLTQFPYINSSYNVRAFVTTMNESGFRGSTVIADANWTS